MISAVTEVFFHKLLGIHMGAGNQEVALLFLPWQSSGLQNLVFQKAQLAHKEIADLSITSSSAWHGNELSWKPVSAILLGGRLTVGF